MIETKWHFDRPMTIIMEAVPHSAFASTSYEQWHDAMSVLYAPVLDDRSADCFHANVTSYRLNAGTLNRCASVRQGFRRSEAKIAHDGLDHYMVQVFRKGACSVLSGDRPVMNAGDICIFDSAHPLDTVNEDFDLLALVVPRERLAPLLHDPDGAHYGRIAARSPLARIFRTQLVEMYRTMPTMTLEQADAVFLPLIELLAAVMNGGLDLLPRQKTAIRYGILQSARKYIDANLGSQTLTVEHLAAHFGVSRSSLYRLLEPVGGVGGYVQRRRLAVAHARLAGPTPSAGSIGAVAALVGFQSESGFIRAFRRLYGMTPGDVRAAAANRKAGTTNRPASIHEKSWSEWLAEF